MSDRLKDLQRQRALAQEQLAWLDREIAREAGQVAAPVPPTAPLAASPATPAPAAADASQVADEILAQYRHESEAKPGDVKRGCFLYFALAFVLLGLGLVVWYLLSASRQ